MALTPIDIVALVFIFLALGKITVILVNRRSWLNVSKILFNHSRESSFVLIVLGIIALFFILGDMTVIQFIGAMAFAAIIAGLMILQYPREFLNIAKKSVSRDISVFELLYIIFWAIMLIWAFVEIIS